MRRFVLTAVTAALVLPATGQAKELASATVCGASGCKTYAHPGQALGGGGDGFGDPAPPAGPYYTLKLTVDEGGAHGAWTIFYVPGAEMLAFRGEAGRMVFELPSAEFKRTFHRYAYGLQPFPTPTVTSGTVGSERIADPESYLSLYTERGDGGGDAYPAASDFVPITLHATRPSPWTESRYLMFSPSTGSLERGTRVVQLRPATVKAIAARDSLASSPAGGDFAWPLVTGTLAAVLAMAVATLFLLRRSRDAATA